MRYTFGNLISASQDVCIDDTSATYTGLSDTKSFIKREINNANTDLFNLLKKYKLQPPPYTEPTIATQKYYNFRPGFSKLTSLTVNVGTYIPPLKIVESEDEWNTLQAVPSVSGWPTHVFPRRDTYGIYPTPQSVYTMTLTGLWIPLNMTANDYSTGTIELTNGSANIVGTTTAFTASMVGMWIASTDSNGVPSGNFYRIATFTDTTHIAVDRNVIDASASGLTYVVGQSPEIPEELHQFIPYKVGAAYYSLRRRNPTIAQELLNYYYTGDYNNSKREGEFTGGVLNVLNDLLEKGRSNSALVETGGTSGTVDIIRDASWTSLITAS
jgi:hypothetical protein